MSQRLKSRKRKGSAKTRRSSSRIDVQFSQDFFDRDLSLLAFNQRVLEQAEDKDVPLLERFFFLSIFQSNLDEFFMKRVNFTRAQIQFEKASGSVEQGYHGWRLGEIRKTVIALYQRAHRCLHEELLVQLNKEKVRILAWKDLEEADRQWCSHLFREKVFPVLTPLAVDPAHPFPFISNQSTSLAVSLRYPQTEELVFSRIKIPEVFPPLINIESRKGDEVFLIPIHEIINNHLDQLFQKMDIVSSMLFRVTRNIEFEWDTDEEDERDLLQQVASQLKERRFGEVVKLEHPPGADKWLLEFLMSEFDLEDTDVYEMPAPHCLTDLNIIHALPRPHLKYPKWNPGPPLGLPEDKDIFETIRENDVLVHHPFESFSLSVEEFIRRAADDPKVLAIKMTLYRTNSKSSFIRSLIKAAENGKQVVCLVELTARFDEARNITWANNLEDAGVHVVYGIVGLKTHCKTALVVRQEFDGIRCYGHIGTGNYHGQTAKLYTDMGLMTADKTITGDLVELFHYLTGRSVKDDYRSLVVAPTSMKKHLLRLIEQESQFGAQGRIVFKCNNLEDQDIVQALYKASEAGVRIDLIIRSICTLKPGMKDLSENIRVISIVDRLLEHSRVYHFSQGQEESAKGVFLIGSADLMFRNLLRRVEVLVPLEQPELKARLAEELRIILSDRAQAWQMQADGTYQRPPRQGESSQTRLKEKYLQLSQKRRGY